MKRITEMNHDATHCSDFCASCPMNCYRAELEVDLRRRWAECMRGNKESEAKNEHKLVSSNCKWDNHRTSADDTVESEVEV